MYNPYDKEAMQKAGLMWTGFILLLALAFWPAARFFQKYIVEFQDIKDNLNDND